MQHVFVNGCSPSLLLRPAGQVKVACKVSIVPTGFGRRTAPDTWDARGSGCDTSSANGRLAMVDSGATVPLRYNETLLKRQKGNSYCISAYKTFVCVCTKARAV